MRRGADGQREDSPPPDLHSRISDRPPRRSAPYFRNRSWVRNPSPEPGQGQEPPSLLDRLSPARDSLLRRIDGSPASPRARPAAQSSETYARSEQMEVETERWITDGGRRAGTAHELAEADMLIASIQHSIAAKAAAASHVPGPAPSSPASEAAVDDLLTNEAGYNEELPDETPPAHTHTPPRSPAPILARSSIPEKEADEPRRNSTLLEETKRIIVSVIVQDAQLRRPDTDVEAVSKHAMRLVTEDQCREMVKMAQEVSAEMAAREAAKSLHLDGIGGAEPTEREPSGGLGGSTLGVKRAREEGDGVADMQRPAKLTRHSSIQDTNIASRPDAGSTSRGTSQPSTSSGKKQPPKAPKAMLADPKVFWPDKPAQGTTDGPSAAARAASVTHSDSGTFESRPPQPPLVSATPSHEAYLPQHMAVPRDMSPGVTPIPPVEPSEDQAIQEDSFIAPIEPSIVPSENPQLPPLAVDNFPVPLQAEPHPTDFATPLEQEGHGDVNFAAAPMRAPSVPPPPPCHVPGIWFATVGRSSRGVFDAEFYVDPDAAAAALRWAQRHTAFSADAQHVSVHLLCLPVEQVAAANEELDPSASPADVAAALWKIPTRWPEGNGLVVDMNRARKWFPVNLVPDAGPLDVSGYVQPGWNVARFIHLTDHSHCMFVLHASVPPHEERQALAAKAEEWRDWANFVAVSRNQPGHHAWGAGVRRQSVGRAREMR